MTKYIIYWWANIGRKINGKDTIEYDGELTEAIADDILSHNADARTRKDERLETFSDRYLNADHCLNFGVKKIKKVKGETKE